MSMYDYETRALGQGKKNIAGTDEAGRGPLAGPVVAAAVILDPNKRIEGLNDSKKLSKSVRDKLFKEIKKKALAYSVCFIDNKEIDEINILEASRKAMTIAIKSLEIKPDFIITDYMKLKEIDIPFIDLAHGDALSASVAAASIVAKVTRDKYMEELDTKYPGYSFKKNKGYPTKEHIEAIRRLGVTDIHRKTYSPVSEIINSQISFDI